MNVDVPHAVGGNIEHEWIALSAPARVCVKTTNTNDTILTVGSRESCHHRRVIHKSRFWYGVYHHTITVMSRSNDTKDKGSSRAVADVARGTLHADVGQRIRSVRKGLRIGQAECARGAGIDVSSMFRIEKTGQNLTVETLARLAISLGVTMDELLLGIVPDPDLIEPRNRG